MLKDFFEKKFHLSENPDEISQFDGTKLYDRNSYSLANHTLFIHFIFDANN
jgi:hypothetical protein